MKKSILITGASRGIGKAVACRMAAKGHDLALTFNKTADLEKTCAELQKRYPDIHIEVRKLDVRDYDNVSRTTKELDTKMDGLDIVFANAGVYTDGRAGRGNFSKYRNNIEVNLLGAIATVDAAVEIFSQRKRGHIVVSSSVMAARGLPRNASYTASKAGLEYFMETLRAELYNTSIDLTVLRYGYIDTDINRSLKSRPFLISAEKGAEIICRKIERKSRRATIPAFPWAIASIILKRLPAALVSKL